MFGSSGKYVGESVEIGYTDMSVHHFEHICADAAFVPFQDEWFPYH
jgi:hypothetical protein